MNPNKPFEVLSVEEMRRKYGLVAANRPVVKLNPARVPIDLQPLIPYAELWGVGDDLIRGDMLRSAAPEALEDLKRVIELFDDALDEWLAGPEADNAKPTDEYLAFSAMRMAADGV